MLEHEFQSPFVTEITVRLTSEGDDFGQANAVEVDLFPRLSGHYERQIDFHKEEQEKSEQFLARITLLYSNQLSFDFGVSDEPA